MRIDISIGDWRDVSVVMPVMERAFDPAFGEAWSSAQVSALLTMPGSWLTILRIDDVVAGFALMRAIIDEAELMLFAIDPDRRRNGNGRFLLHHVLRQAYARNVRRVFLEMRCDNQAAAMLYTSAGFIKAGRRPAYYRGENGCVRDAVTMSISVDEENMTDNSLV